MTHSFGKSSIAIGSEYNEKRKKDYTTAKGVTKPHFNRNMKKLIIINALREVPSYLYIDLIVLILIFLRKAMQKS
ncbi:hypothetical protein BHOIPH791_01380 [Bartonella henselae]|nr:hypothetical protein BhenCHDE101_00820 [Bartonella henselae]ETS07518.1 hypothetical protein Q653_01171 [Bartonella henselae JK 42]ETS10282.1 hypothetical protein Q654_00564 [Bartonella henselae JK 50]ETS10789.1 hypothetical protein Q655_00512 [Bartonella henselae JK 51]ETS16321.1 hypothetical protein Q652_00005 [Bartonella henselae JK 41]KEC57819.1 hypothetical protein O97_00854 [Bartonella henselae str. Zeus]KEC62859.1 hypothetical protein O95_00468 [Bartonella henselae JK 53]PNM36656.1 